MKQQQTNYQKPVKKFYIPKEFTYVSDSPNSIGLWLNEELKNKMRRPKSRENIIETQKLQIENNQPKDTKSYITVLKDRLEVLKAQHTKKLSVGHRRLKSQVIPSNQSHQKELDETVKKVQSPATRRIETNLRFSYYAQKLLEAVSGRLNRDLRELYTEHLVHCEYSVDFIKSHPPVTESSLLDKLIYLPPSSIPGRRTLVLDLDETLIHCTETPLESSHPLPIQFPNSETLPAFLSIRPFARQFLANISLHYEVVVFTASYSCYANAVIDKLDPDNKFIVSRVYRNSCIETEEGVFLKDLRIFANRKLSDILLVDNSFYSYGYQLDNGIPIIPFTDQKNDRELVELYELLLELKELDGDVRDVLKKSLCNRVLFEEGRESYIKALSRA